MITFKTRIHMHYTDAAGVLFFANQFKMVHDAYESLLKKSGFPYEKILTKESFLIPIVHAEADFKSPLTLGDEITIKVKIERIGETSLTLNYFLTNAFGVVVGTAKTVHVTISKGSRLKIPLPEKFKKALQKLK